VSGGSPNTFPWGDVSGFNGGGMGGGAGSFASNTYFGGVGGIVVEWFYD
jgi:hypothetical protein